MYAADRAKIRNWDNSVLDTGHGWPQPDTFLIMDMDNDGYAELVLVGESSWVVKKSGSRHFVVTDCPPGIKKILSISKHQTDTTEDDFNIKPNVSHSGRLRLNDLEAIEYKVYGCIDSCPSYQVNITPDGMVAVMAKNGCAVSGPAVFKLDSQNMMYLITALSRLLLPAHDTTFTPGKAGDMPDVLIIRFKKGDALRLVDARFDKNRMMAALYKIFSTVVAKHVHFGHAVEFETGDSSAYSPKEKGRRF